MLSRGFFLGVFFLAALGAVKANSINPVMSDDRNGGIEHSIHPGSEKRAISIVESPEMIETQEPSHSKGVYSKGIGEILAEVTPNHVRKGELLTIPKTENVSFLKGVWRCKMGDLRSVKEQLPIQLEFFFGSNGRGGSYIKEQNGAVYKASALASLHDGVLEILTTSYEYKTSEEKTSRYRALKFLCKQFPGQSAALCSGESEDPETQKRYAWDNVKFVRIE